GRDCTLGRSIFTTAAFQEHELVHAFMADVSQPAFVLGEGLAQHAACLKTQLAYSFWPPSAWPAAVEPQTDEDDLKLYGFGQRLVAWMVQNWGIQRFVEFYRTTLRSTDASLFALHFEKAAGRRLVDVAQELADDGYAGSACACTAAEASADGSPWSFVAGQDYRTMEIGEQSRLELASDTGPFAYPASCTNALDAPRSEGSSGGPALTVARVSAGHYRVATIPGTDGSILTGHRTQRPMHDWSCQAALAAPIKAGSRPLALWMTADLTPQGTWFAVQTDGPRVLATVSDDTSAASCAACDQCSDVVDSDIVTEATVSPPPGGVLLIHLTGGQANPFSPYGGRHSMGAILRLP
ncbi:MAG: hypothetical protein QOI66_2085, partial [Myxococcales bacterium]|nr:hypothetical protein [Myxococcales bacterium]